MMSQIPLGSTGVTGTGGGGGGLGAPPEDPPEPDEPLPLCVEESTAEGPYEVSVIPPRLHAVSSNSESDRRAFT
jgi:hypothetical protein